MKLITEQWTWDHQTFESYIEGMCHQVRAFPSEHITFWASTTPEVILTFFAIWKVGKIACPLNTRLPKAPLTTELFTPFMPRPKAPTLTDWDLTRAAAHLFTSGSTGNPKIAQLTLGNLVYSAEGSNQILPLKQDDVWGLTLPLFHVGGLGILLRSYLAKSAVTLNTNLATRLSLVPTQLYRLLKEPLPLLKTVLLGGAPLPDLNTPWHVVPTYGMTEMSSQIVTDHKVHPHAELRIENDQEIWVKGKVLFQGYLGHPPVEGWFPTGDLGRWERGKFQILGRKDNMFISGGENIQPEEVEEVIRRVCGLGEAIVVPLQCPEFGQRPGVFLNDPSLFSTLQEQLKDHLPKYKIPIKAFQLPTQNGLKPNRKALASIAASDYHFSQ